MLLAMTVKIKGFPIRSAFWGNKLTIGVESWYTAILTVSKVNNCELSLSKSTKAWKSGWGIAK